MQIPLDFSIQTLDQLPHTLTYVIRKRQQVDSLMELPKDKRPTETLIWLGNPEELEEWFEKVYPRDGKKRTRPEDSLLVVDTKDIEE